MLTRRIEPSIIVALFFAIHPMHVESVAWISERKDVLYSFFYIGSLIAYINYLKKSKKTKYLLYSLSLFIFSLLSKSMAVTLPLVLILIDYYYKRKFKNKVIVEKIPFFVLSILFGIIAILSQKASGATDISPLFSLLDKVFIAGYAIMFYIVKMFVPFKLSALHYYPIKVNGVLPVEYYIAFVVIMLVILLVYRMNKSNNFRKVLIFGMLFFLITIFLVLQIIPIGNVITAERYTYIPYIGLFFIIGQSYCYLVDSKNFGKKMKPFLVILLIGYTVFFSITTFNRNKVWKNGIVLFSDVIENYPFICHAYWARGIAKYNNNDFKGSIDDYDKSIELNHSYLKAYNNRGGVKFILQDYKGAIKDFNKVIKLRPDYSAAYYNRGLAEFGLLRYNEAMKGFDKSIKLKPDYSEAYYNRGLVQGIFKNDSKAVADFNKAIKLNPDYTDAYFNRGIARYNLHNVNGACNDWRKSVLLGDTLAKRMLYTYCR